MTPEEMAARITELEGGLASMIGAAELVAAVWEHGALDIAVQELMSSAYCYAPLVGIDLDAEEGEDDAD